MRRVVRAALACLLSTAAVVAVAQTFPQQPVTIVVPYTAGGATDNLARELANRLADRFKQPFVIDNKPGAGTMIASNYVAKAKPDGYTLLLAASSLGIAPSLYKNVAYDPLKSFEPIALLASITHVLSINPGVPAKNVQEFVAWAKANSGKVNYASVGAGTTTHLEAELFKKMAGVEMTHVAYKGSQQAVVDLAAGQVQAMFDAYTSSAPLAKDGRLRMLGVTTERRSATAPELPTIAEQGVVGFDVRTWMGLLAPAGTPQNTVKALNEAVADALRDPKFQEKLKSIGFEALGGSAQDFKAFLHKDVTTWSTFIRSQNITLEQ